MNGRRYDQFVRNCQGILDHAFEAAPPQIRPRDEYALQLRIESLVDRACSLSAQLGTILKELEQCLANETARPD